MIWRRTFSQKAALKLILISEEGLTRMSSQSSCAGHSAASDMTGCDILIARLENRVGLSDCVTLVNTYISGRTLYVSLRAHVRTMAASTDPHRQQPRSLFVLFIQATAWSRPQTARCQWCRWLSYTSLLSQMMLQLLAPSPTTCSQ